MNLIRAFLDVVIPVRETRVRATQATIETLGTYVAPASVALCGHEMRYLLPYHTPLVRSVIVEAKFYEHTHAHRQLGLLLAEFLLSFLEDAAFEEVRYVLVPVPLSKRRYRERGYNQVELVLRESLKHLPCAFSINTHLLRRVRDTPPQTKLGRNARLKNMEGAFECVELPHSGVTYILVDDVATTGATLQAGHEALVSKGAQEVQMLALAH